MFKGLELGIVRRPYIIIQDPQSYTAVQNSAPTLFVRILGMCIGILQQYRLKCTDCRHTILYGNNNNNKRSPIWFYYFFSTRTKHVLSSIYIILYYSTDIRVMEKNRFRCRTSYYGVLCRRGDEWARGTMELYSKCKLVLIDGHHQLPLQQWSMEYGQIRSAVTVIYDL